MYGVYTGSAATNTAKCMTASPRRSMFDVDMLLIKLKRGSWLDLELVGIDSVELEFGRWSIGCRLYSMWEC